MQPLELNDGKQNGEKGRPFLEQIKFHGAKIGLSESNCEQFWNYYEANGWRVGKNPMRSWKSALANWKIRSAEWPHAGNGQSKPASIGDLRTVLIALGNEFKEVRRQRPKAPVEFRDGERIPVGEYIQLVRVYREQQKPFTEKCAQLEARMKEVNNQLARMA